jgi:hypothetical protein
MDLPGMDALLAKNSATLRKIVILALAADKAGRAAPAARRRKVAVHLSCNTSQRVGVQSPSCSKGRRTTMIRTTLATLALITAAGVAHAQMQAPSTPGGRAMDSMPGGTSNPSTDFPKTPSTAWAAAAAAKSAIEQRGYTGVKSLTRDMAGNWAAKAMRDNVEVAVILEPNGNIREQ